MAESINAKQVLMLNTKGAIAGLAWARRAATKMAAAVREGGNCRMAMSESASVARANAQPAARRTAAPSERSQPRRWQYTLRQWMAAMHSMSCRSTAMMLDSILSRAMSACDQVLLSYHD